jgi:hypothetical protein
VVLIGIWGARLISMSGEDAVYGLFVLLIDAVLVTYGLAAIGLRKLIIKSPAA